MSSISIALAAWLKHTIAARTDWMPACRVHHDLQQDRDGDARRMLEPRDGSARILHGAPLACCVEIRSAASDKASWVRYWRRGRHLPPSGSKGAR